MSAVCDVPAAARSAVTLSVPANPATVVVFPPRSNTSVAVKFPPSQSCHYRPVVIVAKVATLSDNVKLPVIADASIVASLVLSVPWSEIAITVTSDS